MPILVPLASYNWHFLGAPWRFGQTNLAARDIKVVTGSDTAGMWSTPPWVGAAGLMLSPSRGLLVYSPFMIFALAGATQAWRRKEFAALRPLPLAILALWMIASCYFKWWGGWCFGYRPIVDTMPLLAVLLVPVINWLFERRAALAVGAALLAWSVAVQWVGVWSYNELDWNSPPEGIGLLIRVPGMKAPLEVHDPLELKRVAAKDPSASVIRRLSSNVDLPKNRWRLWSLADSQLFYFFTHYSAGHENRRNRCKDPVEWVF
jgi:hypothetical protein